MSVPRSIYVTGAIQEDLASSIGEAATTRLIERFGGSRVYIPRTITPNHPIAEAIGMKAAAILSRSHSSMYIDLPKPHVRRARALEAALSREMTIRDVALAFDYTERMIYKLLANHAERQKADDDQLDLFDLK